MAHLRNLRNSGMSPRICGLAICGLKIKVLLAHLCRKTRRNCTLYTGAEYTSWRPWPRPDYRSLSFKHGWARFADFSLCIAWLAGRYLGWLTSPSRLYFCLILPLQCTKWNCKTSFEMEDTDISILIIMSSPKFQISKPNLPSLSRPDEFTVSV
jgi:hypothetical protein